MAGQHGEAVLRDRDRRLERRNARQRRLELRAGARGVELGAASRGETHLDEAQRLALVVGVLARHAQALLQTAQLQVASRHLARR